MDTMKVLYFHQHFSTPRGTIGNRSYQMAKRLLAHGHEVTMVCGSYGGGVTGITQPFSKGMRRGVVDGIDVIEFDLAYSNANGFWGRVFVFLRFVFKSVGLVFNEPFDLVFATSTPLTAGIPGVLAKRFRRKPFVFEVRDLWPELPEAMGVIRNKGLLRLLRGLEKLIYHSADYVIGLSPGIVDGIKRAGTPSKKVSFVPNGCDISIFKEVQQQYRPEGVSSHDLMVVYTGTHGPANGLDAVLDVAAVLKKRANLAIKFVLVGDGKQKAALQTRAKLEKLSSVIFLDPMPKAELACLMKAADVGMQILANIPAFYYGTSPNKFFDYISCGLPVLNNYPGWLAELIHEAECGFVVAPDKPDLFADCLEYADKHRDELSCMGENAFKLAHQKFDRNNLSKEWATCLEQVFLQFGASD